MGTLTLCQYGHALAPNCFEFGCGLILLSSFRPSIFAEGVLFSDIFYSDFNLDFPWCSLDSGIMAKILQSASAFTSSNRMFPSVHERLIHTNHNVKDGSFFNGQFKRILKEPSGVPHQEWINNIPNDGLIYYTSLLNVERLLITSPQALGEVLTTKSYEFIKPQMLRNGLGRILGTGLILAEGEEHKVCYLRLRC